MPAPRSSGSISVAAARDEVLAALIDVEAYPAWAKAVKGVRVLEKDDTGHPAVVEFRSGALGRSVRYVLRYDHGDHPDGFSWRLVEGDFRTLDGAYRLTERGGVTDVRYDMQVALGFPLPGFLLHQAEKIVLGIALKELKAYVER